MPAASSAKARCTTNRSWLGDHRGRAAQHQGGLLGERHDSRVFDEYPDRIAPSASTPIYALTNSLIDEQIYPRSGGPFGMNGAFYYTRLRVTF